MKDIVLLDTFDRADVRVSHAPGKGPWHVGMWGRNLVKEAHKMAKYPPKSEDA